MKLMYILKIDMQCLKVTKYADFFQNKCSVEGVPVLFGPEIFRRISERNAFESSVVLLA